MATSSRATARSSKVSKLGEPAEVAAKRRRVPVADKAAPTTPDPYESAHTYFSEVEDAFCNLADSHMAYECLQSFLSPRYPPLEGGEEFHIEPHELRGLVTVLNAEMKRQLQTLRGTIRGMRERMNAGR